MSHDESSHTCACGGSCGCQNSQESDRTYLTREEYIGELQRYLADLRAEVKAVENELVKLQSTVEMVAP